VGIDGQLLAGFGVLHHDEADVGQLDFHRVIQPHCDHLVTTCELREPPPQPGVLMKSEMTKTTERRFITAVQKTAIR